MQENKGQQGGGRRERRGRWGRIMERCSDSPAYSTLFSTCKYSIFMFLRLRRAQGRHSWDVVSGKLQQFWLRLRIERGFALPSLSLHLPLLVLWSACWRARVLACVIFKYA